MKKLMTAAVAMSLVGSAAFAGGPVVIIDEPAPVVVTENSSSSGAGSGAVIPLVLGAVLLCAVACGSDS